MGTPARLLSALLYLCSVLALPGCGGDSSSPAPAPTTGIGAPANPVVNTTAVVFDAGPAALSPGHNAFNSPFVTITICAPGSATNCQTIDHVVLDTGSVGLRILAPAIGAALLALLPAQTDATGNPVGECYQYVSSYAFGSVRQGDFSIAGETVPGMPFQVVADGGAFAAVPAACSAGGGKQITTIDDIAANAILGIGSTATDCGTFCASAGNGAAASYYDCPASGCAQIIARSAVTRAPFEQLPNPVAAMPADNNGSILTLPAVPQQGVATLTGTLTFGIGTQPDNRLTAQTILTLTTSHSDRGPGLLTATYQGRDFIQSYLDTGSGAYYFTDSALAACTQADLTMFYCPPGPMLLSPTLTGANGISTSAAFTLYNPTDLAATSYVAPGLGINPQIAAMTDVNDQSFAFGIPFYFGRTVFTAIEGTNAGGTPGPYVAF